MKLIDDWQQYLTDPSMFDDEYFERLLFAEDIFRSPEQLFATLPGGKTIVDRLKRLVIEWRMNGSYFIASGSAENDIQISRAQLYVNELANLGDDEGLEDDAASLRSAPIVLTTDRKAFDEMSRSRDSVASEIPDLLFDIEQELMNKRDPRLFGAYQAILGLTTRPEITSWVMAESLSSPINLEPAYEIYRDGGKIFLGSEAIQLLVS